MVENFADPEFAIRWVCTILGLSAILNSFHCLALRRHFRDDGVWSWDVLGTGRSPVMCSDYWTQWMGHSGVLLLHGMRTAVVLVLVTHSGVISLRTTAIWCVFLIQVLLNLRSASSEGSQVISHVTWAALALGHILPRDPIVAEACLLFITLQACLSYTGNGWAKWHSSRWRSGEALELIASHSLSRSVTLVRFLRRHPELSKLMTRATLLAECAFPVVLFLGFPWCCLVLGCGVIFHLLIALFLGLTEFPLSFLSTYPAIIFVVLRTELVLYA